MTGAGDQDRPRPSQEAVDAFCEYLHLLELQAEVDFERFCAERAPLTAQLRQLEEEWERISGILDRLAPSESFSGRLRARYGESVDPHISLEGEEPEGAGPPAPPEPPDEDAGPASAGSSAADRLGETVTRLSGAAASGTRYENVEEIARGGMGAVLKVWDAELRRTVAMKVVLGRRKSKDDEESQVDQRRLSRFLEEAQVTSQLVHPGIVPVHDIGIDGRGRVFFTMQLVDGRDLRAIFELARLEREGWTRTRVLWVMLRVCEAMAYAHSKGVVHRDLKPANIMVGRFGEAYVMDWGLAKVIDREDRHDLRLEDKAGAWVHTARSESDDDVESPLRTMDGDIVGTPAYMAPEQALGRLSELGPHSDVYAVGAMLYHLLSGHMPYEPLGEKVATTTILEAVRNGPPWALHQIDANVDGELAAVCEKAMARDPADRYPNMMDVAEDLRAYLEGRAVGAYTTGLMYEVRKWVARNKPMTGALVALLLLIVASVVLFVVQQARNLNRLEQQQEQTEIQREKAEDNLQLARQNEVRISNEAKRAREAAEEADRQSRIANTRADMLRRGGYRAHIDAAAYSLRLDEVVEARLHLDACTDVTTHGWEWRHLMLSVNGSVGEVLHTDSAITHVAVTADGARALFSERDGSQRFYDLGSMEQIELLEKGVPTLSWSANSAPITCALSPDGHVAALPLMAFPEDGKLIQLASTITGEVGYVLGGNGDGHLSQVTDLGFSADGRRLFSVALDGTVRVWDTLIGRRIALLGEGLGLGALSCGAFSPEAARVAAGGRESPDVRVWEVAGERQVAHLSGNRESGVAALAWSPTGDRIAVGYEDGTTVLWRWIAAEGAAAASAGRPDASAAGRWIRGTVLGGHYGAVLGLSFSSDGTRLLSGGEDRTLRLWDTAEGRQLRVFRGHDGAVTEVVADLGGEGMALSVSEDGTLRRWDPRWDPAITEVRAVREVVGLGWTAEGAGLLALPRSGDVERWDARSFRHDTLDTARHLVQELEQAPLFDVLGANWAMAVSSSGERVAVIGTDKVPRVFDAATGELLLELPRRSRQVHRMAFDAAADRLALGDTVGNAIVYSLDDPKAAPIVLEGHQRGVHAVAFSPDGSLLATAGTDKDLRVWRAADGAPERIWRNAHAGRIYDLDFAPDGQRIVSASRDHLAKVWALGEQEPTRVLAGHTEPVQEVDWSPDGRRVVTGSMDGTVRVWDIEDGESLLTLRGHEGGVAGLEVSPDGACIASSDRAGVVRVWDSRPPEARYEAWARERELERRAAPLVERLYREHLLPDAVQAAIDADEDLDPTLAQRAREAAKVRARDVAAMRALCRSVVSRATATAEQRDAALRLASWLRSARPALLSARALVGAAQVMAGEYEEGTEELEAVVAARDQDGRQTGASPFELVFLALGRLRCGQAGPARLAADRARGSLARLQPAEEDDERLGVLLEVVEHELEALGVPHDGG